MNRLDEEREEDLARNVFGVAAQVDDDGQHGAE
jgi:hypothetical protein